VNGLDIDNLMIVNEL